MVRVYSGFTDYLPYFFRTTLALIKTEQHSPFQTSPLRGWYSTRHLHHHLTSRIGLVNLMPITVLFETPVRVTDTDILCIRASMTSMVSHTLYQHAISVTPNPNQLRTYTFESYISLSVISSVSPRFGVAAKYLFLVNRPAGLG